MVLGKQAMMVVGIIAICLSTTAYANQGTATFYTPPYVPSSCYGYQDNGVMIAAASDALWGNRAACGRKYTVKCTGPTNQGVPQPCRGQSVVVKIVDYCPPGCHGTIDLSQEAFSIIADPNAGKINIEYSQV
ncbi:EG45-like domain containing protein [Actinidia eriantha]|uniref:EG45-like domain containing protein n=1 Tax=Actinidia eriantha TaxID=165200 RepID=UPI0025902B91|nr:EG45-like domain containing protein [Actinidia eriantha]